MSWFKILQPIIAILLMLSILLQNRGSSLSGIFGGSGDIYRTKRGFEKFLFIATIVLAILFFAIAIASISI
jgi:preprotein translocase subunit SecG